MVPEGYIIITVEEPEFLRIVKENFSKKNKAIVYVSENIKYLIDTKAHIMVQTTISKQNLHKKT